MQVAIGAIHVACVSLWAVAVAAGDGATVPASCAEARQAGHYTDGEYRLRLAGTTASVFCYMMGENVTVPGAPFAYITLRSTTPGANQAQWARVGAITTTRFSRVRLDEHTLRVHTGDFTFATTTTDDPYCCDQIITDEPGVYDLGCEIPPGASCAPALCSSSMVPFGLTFRCGSVSGQGQFPTCTEPGTLLTANASIDFTDTDFTLQSAEHFTMHDASELFIGQSTVVVPSISSTVGTQTASIIINSSAISCGLALFSNLSTVLNNELGLGSFEIAANGGMHICVGVVGANFSVCNESILDGDFASFQRNEFPINEASQCYPHEYEYSPPTTSSDRVCLNLTNSPTALPSTKPTVMPTVNPTLLPTMTPSKSPTARPTTGPTSVPTVLPTAWPTGSPTLLPTTMPSDVPTSFSIANSISGTTTFSTMQQTHSSTVSVLQMLPHAPTALPSTPSAYTPAISPAVRGDNVTRSTSYKIDVNNNMLIGLFVGVLSLAAIVCFTHYQLRKVSQDNDKSSARGVYDVQPLRDSNEKPCNLDTLRNLNGMEFSV